MGLISNLAGVHTQRSGDVLQRLKEFFSYFTVSDDFKGDWYGYACNQLSHVLLGFLFAGFVSMWTWFYRGEYLDKNALFAVCSISYLSFEFYTQRFKDLKDTLEDYVFFAIYGSGSAVYLFSEVEAGSPVLQTDLRFAGPIAVVVLTHIGLGVSKRMSKPHD